MMYSWWKVLGLIGLWTIGIFSAALAQEPLTITYGEPWKELIEPTIAEFEQATGIQVEAYMVPYGVDMVEKVSLDLAAGTATDIFMVDSFMIPSYAEAGYLYPLDSYLASWPDWHQYFPGMQEIVAFGGQHYGVMIDTDVRMLWYWKPIFEEAGIPIPWEPRDWTDVLTTALIIKQRCPEVDAPLFIPMGTKWGEGTTMQGFYMVLLGADTPASDRNRLRKWDVGMWIGESPALAAALDFYRKVFVEYELCPVDPHYVPDVWGEWRRMMRAGEIGIGLGGSWEWAEFWPKAELPSVEEREAVLGWAPMPGSGAPGAPEIACISGGWALGINAATDKPDIAWQFFETLFTRDRLGEWLASAGKIATRKDVTQVPAYAADAYLVDVLRLMEYTTYRDTYPGYPTVSFYIQEATADVSVEGLSPAEAMASLYQKLVDEFGVENVIKIVSVE